MAVSCEWLCLTEAQESANPPMSSGMLFSSSVRQEQPSSSHPSSAPPSFPPRRKKLARWIWPLFSGLFFPTFDSGYAPLPSTLELFNLEGQRRMGKVRCMYLEGECFGGSFGKNSWGDGVIRGWECREMAWGENGEERQSRAGGSGGTTVAAQSCQTRLGPLGRIGCSQQSRAPSAPSLGTADPIHLSPQAHVLALPCLLSLPNISSALPHNCPEVRF